MCAWADTGKIREKRAWIIDSFSIEEENPGPFPYKLGKVSRVLTAALFSRVFDMQKLIHLNENNIDTCKCYCVCFRLNLIGSI